MKIHNGCTRSTARQARKRWTAPIGASALALLSLLSPTAASGDDTPASLVVWNEVNRSYKVTMTPNDGGEAETVSIAQGKRHTFTIPAPETCTDLSVELEFRYVNSVLNRVDSRATYPLVAVETDSDVAGELDCSLTVRKPIGIYERSYDNYLRWSKLDASKGRVTFAIRYGE